MNPESRIQNPGGVTSLSVIRVNGRGSWAFTLIELLVAMAVLLIIVLIVAKVFAQASSTWTTGARRVEMNMTGRAVADFVAQDLSQAVIGSNYEFTVSASAANFWIIGDASNTTRAAVNVTYSFSGAALTRSGQQICDTNLVGFAFSQGPGFVSGQSLPLYVDVLVTVSDGRPVASNRVFQSRAEFPNRNRYKY